MPFFNNSIEVEKFIHHYIPCRCEVFKDYRDDSYQIHTQLYTYELAHDATEQDTIKIINEIVNDYYAWLEQQQEA